jgi:hypothetical protein
MKRSATRTPIPKQVLPAIVSLLLLASFPARSGAEDAEFYWNTAFRASEEYNDNIFLESEAEGPVDDFITVLSQSLTLGVRTQEIDASIDLSVGYAFYQEREDSGGIRGNVDLNGFRDIHLSDNWVLDLDESFTVTEDPIEFGPDTDEGVYGIERDPYYSNREERERYYRNRFRGELAYQFGEEDELYWGYTNRLVENSSDRVRDAMWHQPFTGLRYWFNVQHGFEASLRYTRADFEDAAEADDPLGVADFDGLGGSATYYFRMDELTVWSLSYSLDTRDFDAPGRTDYDVHNASLGFSRQLTETFSVSASAGYFWQDLDNGNTNGGPSASLDLTKEFEYGTLQVGGSMGFREQYLEAENLGASEYRLVRASYTFDVTEDISVRTGAGYFENDYLQLGIRSDDSTWYGDVALSYRVLEWMTASLHYNHQDRSASNPRNEYEVNSVMLSISIPYEGKPRPF